MIAERPSTQMIIGLFLICLTTLMYELALTRIFSVLMWYHFASMAISLALFGSGVAALTVHFGRGLFPVDKTSRDAARYSRLFAISTALFFCIFLLFNKQPHIGFKVLSFFHQPFFQPFQQGVFNQNISLSMILVLGLLYLFTAMPFFFSGIVVTLILTRNICSINRLYFWDLLGAGLGCLAIIPILHLFGGINSLLVVSLFGLIASILFVEKGWRQYGSYAAGLIIIGLLIGNMAAPFADINFVRGRYEPNILWKEWNSFSRVAVYPTQSQTMERAWGLSRTHTGAIPEQLGMVVDDTGYTTLYRFEEGEHEEFFRKNVIALPYHLKEAPIAAVIGPGGGKDVLAAISSGAKKVYAVEINDLIAKAVNDRFAPFTGGLYQRPDVQLVVDEGRSFIRRTDERFDIIQASAVFGRMPPAAGAFTLSQNNLYTVEAFRDYWDHLSDDGILTISRFIFERESLRLVSLGLELLKELGVEEPSQHIAVVRERGLANFMLKRTPFSDAELKDLQEMVIDEEFDIVYLPGSGLGNKVFHELIASNGSDEFYDNFPYDIRPTTDNNPFFYYMLKAKDFMRLFSFPDDGKFEDRAIMILRNLIIVVCVLVSLFLLLPLILWQRKSGPPPLAIIPYFAALGLGFMFVEIGLLRSFILYLGHPVYALAIILFSLLIFSGIGSRLAATIEQRMPQRGLLTVLLVLVVVVIIEAMILPPFFTATIAQPHLLRSLISVILIAPPALLMGMPMPMGLRLFHSNDQNAPWSWGINYACSVLGTLLAVVVAMNWGFTATLTTGVAMYLVAMIPVAIRLKGR